MFLAHISEDKTREQSILEHLQGTADLAGCFARDFSCEEWGYGCGLMHDIGKYSKSFQKRLKGGPKTDHATAGAKEMFLKKNFIAACCIVGHHSGLLDGGEVGNGGGTATFFGRMHKELEDYQSFQEEIEIPTFPKPPLKPLGKGGFSISFFIRMLFSCLVDADYLDTERFMSNGQITRNGGESMKVLWERLYHHIEPWLSNKSLETVNGRRTSILKSCIEQGTKEQGIYRLTVPTGGGKTISSLAFALQHAKQHNLKHIIYVIPYTTIIEQNAGIFKEILGKENVLEDHCNVNIQDKEELRFFQLAAENWDKPIIVTTNVQFFESLFSNRTAKCRKLHNITNSVIVFDEAQMLPVPFLKPCIQVITELVYNYHSTAVLCTATQPSLDQFFPHEIKIKEICPNIEGQYQFFKRTILKKRGEITQETLISEIREKKQVLCILNSRKRVQDVYEALKEEGAYHLSTLMYPEHRKRQLREINKRLKAGEVCRLIATSLVEAGVDFDFPAVFRELAGIDSVIQAAGRCNREGKRKKELCETVICTLEKEESYKISREMELPISIGNQIADKYEDISSLEAIQEYFERLYHYQGENLDIKRIVEQFEDAYRSLQFPFASAAEEFQLIEQRTKTVFIPIEAEAKELIIRWKRGERSKALMREMGQYCVNVYTKDFENLQGAGCLETLEEDFYALRSLDYYTEDAGLSLKVS